MKDKRLLVLTDGAGPSTNQRAETVDLVNRYGGNLKCAVVTGSTLSRGIVTALSWFVPGYKAFSPAALDGAFRYLNIDDPHEAEQLKKLVQDLKADLAG